MRNEWPQPSLASGGWIVRAVFLGGLLGGVCPMACHRGDDLLSGDDADDAGEPQGGGGTTDTQNKGGSATGGAAGGVAEGGKGDGGVRGGEGGTGSGAMGVAGMPVAGMGVGAGGAAAVEPPELKGITGLHNQERRKVGVPDLVWDPALATIAQTWASKCVDKDTPAGLVDHNPNRGVGYLGSVGENIFGTTATPTAEEAVGSWVAELKNYSYAQNTCTGVCGHYTQVVWKSTLKVGCAVYKCNNLLFSGTLICDYSPAGNVNGQRPY